MVVHIKPSGAINFEMVAPEVKIVSNAAVDASIIAMKTECFDTGLAQRSIRRKETRPPGETPLLNMMFWTYVAVD